MKDRNQSEWPMRFKPVPEPVKPITFKLLGLILKLETSHYRDGEETHRADISLSTQEGASFILRDAAVPNDIIASAVEYSKQHRRTAAFELAITVRPLAGSDQMQWEVES